MSIRQLLSVIHREILSSGIPMTTLLKMDVLFGRNDKAETTSQCQKNAFSSVTIQTRFDPAKPSIVECDTSHFITLAVLSPPVDGVLPPVAYLSKKMSPAKCNSDIRDKDLLVIVRCSEVWHSHLEGALHQVEVLTDDKNLEPFMTTKLLNSRKARWSEILPCYDFIVKFRRGIENSKAEPLIRSLGDLRREADEHLTHRIQIILKPKNLEIFALTQVTVTLEHTPGLDPRSSRGRRRIVIPVPSFRL